LDNHILAFNDGKINLIAFNHIIWRMEPRDGFSAVALGNRGIAEGTALARRERFFLLND
jgi:hypothetical protein